MGHADITKRPKPNPKRILELFRKLKAHQFDDLVLLLEIPTNLQPPKVLALEGRKAGIVEWASQEDDGLEKLQDMLSELTEDPNGNVKEALKELKSGVVEARIQAAKTLSLSKASFALRPMEEHLQSELDPEVRILLRVAMKGIGTEEAEYALQNAKVMYDAERIEI